VLSEVKFIVYLRTKNACLSLYIFNKISNRSTVFDYFLLRNIMWGSRVSEAVIETFAIAVIDELLFLFARRGIIHISLYIYTGSRIECRDTGTALPPYFRRYTFCACVCAFVFMYTLRAIGIHIDARGIYIYIYNIIYTYM
jgi:hypothetical protein